ncbi:MAG: hypothetical protein P1V51_15340 [Deltaproteobacteria bacterium]|nr:hypothetical protein [Deltaproteobacteria bacterium]
MSEPGPAPADAPPLRFGGALRAVLIFSLLAGLVVLLREVERREGAGDPAMIPAGSQEACLACHALREGPGGAHGGLLQGCESCHLGDPLALEKGRAHRGLEKEPGALETAALTCGRAGCHPDTTRDVQGSLMATAVGLVSVDRLVFGEHPRPGGEQTMAEVLAEAEPSPAEDHLRHLCGGCHLGARRANRDDAVGLGADVGSGCAACHSRKAKEEGVHSPLLPTPDDAQCLGCHSRSGRISLSYRGLSEVLPGQAPPCGESERETLADGRITCRQPADVHQRAGLGCVDCHLPSELMGDGQRHAHQEEAVEVRCADCHPAADAPPRSVAAATVGDPRLRRILAKQDPPLPPGTRLGLGEGGRPLWNLRLEEGQRWLQPKGGGAPHLSKPTPADPDHRQPGHERLACASCHARWAPTCPTCHTRKEPATPQWDFAHAAQTPGAWIETSEGGFARPPTLGLRRQAGSEGAGRIVPVVPGMILEVEPGPGAAPLRHRLFAPLDPHTTGKSRTCEACHLDPLTLGLGRGTIRFGPEGPILEPEEGADDHWTRLGDLEPGRGTRSNLHSLDAPTLQRSLRVGLCLGCHPAKDPIHRDLPGALERLRTSRRCEGPRDPWIFAGPGTAEP